MIFNAYLLEVSTPGLRDLFHLAEIISQFRSTVPINAVVSMGRRNTKLEPALQ
jgi:hypothetical protein